ncbi:MAG: hypothetical protein FJ090_23075 [Deltaproteobacteria bacterium]|nr:hypothetical protein [Deltaproteobacteria bacterium]
MSPARVPCVIMWWDDDDGAEYLLLTVAEVVSQHAASTGFRAALLALEPWQSMQWSGGAVPGAHFVRVNADPRDADSWGAFVAARVAGGAR